MEAKTGSEPVNRPPRSSQEFFQRLIKPADLSLLESLTAYLMLDPNPRMARALGTSVDSLIAESRLLLEAAVEVAAFNSQAPDSFSSDPDSIILYIRNLAVIFDLQGHLRTIDQLEGDYFHPRVGPAKEQPFVLPDTQISRDFFINHSELRLSEEELVAIQDNPSLVWIYQYYPYSRLSRKGKGDIISLFYLWDKDHTRMTYFAHQLHPSPKEFEPEREVRFQSHEYGARVIMKSHTGQLAIPSQIPAAEVFKGVIFPELVISYDYDPEARIFRDMVEERDLEYLGARFISDFRRSITS